MTRSIKRGYRWPPISAKDRLPSAPTLFPELSRCVQHVEDALLAWSRETWTEIIPAIESFMQACVDMGFIDKDGNIIDLAPEEDIC